MYQEERLALILEHIRMHQRVSVQEICDLFGVSRDTARRDLVKLDEQRAIIRTRGGAILPTLSKQVYGYKERLHRESTSKRQIGRVAASLVKEGDYIILDASTTVQFVAEYLSARDVVAITNAIDIADILSGKDRVTIHLLGGRLDREHRFLYGASTIAKVADYRVDKLFLGVGGISADGLSYPHEEEGYVKREMIRRADQVIVLADQTKFGKRLFHKVSGLDPVDLIITDRQPDDEMTRILKEFNIEVMVVAEEGT